MKQKGTSKKCISVLVCLAFVGMMISHTGHSRVAIAAGPSIIDDAICRMPEVDSDEVAYLQDVCFTGHGWMTAQLNTTGFDNSGDDAGRHTHVQRHPGEDTPHWTDDFFHRASSTSTKPGIFDEFVFNVVQWLYEVVGATNEDGSVVGGLALGGESFLIMITTVAFGTMSRQTGKHHSKQMVAAWQQNGTHPIIHGSQSVFRHTFQRVSAHPQQHLPGNHSTTRISSTNCRIGTQNAIISVPASPLQHANSSTCRFTRFSMFPPICPLIGKVCHEVAEEIFGKRFYHYANPNALKAKTREVIAITIVMNDRNGGDLEASVCSFTQIPNSVVAAGPLSFYALGLPTIEHGAALLATTAAGSRNQSSNSSSTPPRRVTASSVLHYLLDRLAAYRFVVFNVVAAHSFLAREMALLFANQSGNNGGGGSDHATIPYTTTATTSSILLQNPYLFHFCWMFAAGFAKNLLLATSSAAHPAPQAPSALRWKQIIPSSAWSAMGTGTLAVASYLITTVIKCHFKSHGDIPSLGFHAKLLEMALYNYLLGFAVQLLDAIKAAPGSWSLLSNFLQRSMDVQNAIKKCL